MSQGQEAITDFLRINSHQT